LEVLARCDPAHRRLQTRHGGVQQQTWTTREMSMAMEMGNGDIFLATLSVAMASMTYGGDGGGWQACKWAMSALQRRPIGAVATSSGVGGLDVGSLDAAGTEKFGRDGAGVARIHWPRRNRRKP
jgi:hypothetical protein